MQDMLALSKVGVAAYNTSVLVNATCEYDGKSFSRCTVTFKGAVFKNELQPIKGDPTALEKRAIELAEREVDAPAVEAYEKAMFEMDRGEWEAAGSYFGIALKANHPDKWECNFLR